MQVDVHLHGILRDHLPPDAKGRATINLEDGASVSDLLIQLGIKRRVIITRHGNQKLEKTHILQDGDQISIFTVIGGGSLAQKEDSLCHTVTTARSCTST